MFHTYKKDMRHHLPSAFLASLMAIGLNSCQIYGLTTGLNLLPDDERAKVIESTAPIDSLTADGLCHIVSVQQIKDFIANGDTVVAYTWVPGCTSDQCIPPSFIERICDDRGYKLLLLLPGFGPTSFTINDARHTPLLLPNYSIYGSKYRWKYLPRFNMDMTGRDDYDFWMFANGQYIKSLRIEDF